MSQRIERSALVWHSAERMFELVNDVLAYPQFLPWCAGSIVHQADEREVLASIEVAKAGVRHSFTTRNQLQSPTAIQMALVDGPFDRLSGGWQFLPLQADACKVVLRLDFAFSGSLGRMAFGTVFNQAANSLVDAFCQRADSLYGRGGR